MFYLSYLQSVCTRRHWPQPHYETSHNPSTGGWYCKVRVNNREYSTDVPYRTETQAREGAATNAYMICRNFSHNDGMYPGQRPGGAVQGLPVAIGSGRRGSRMTEISSCESASSEGEDGTSSGGNSPRSPEDGFEVQILQQQVVPSVPTPRAKRGSAGCHCRRAQVYAYERCSLCLREQGWA
ncbi:hypothetical protein LTR62_008684 [Meristemomyces frigidus]|uniref:DRBM domain-containing protein n=1 Tax=Meristemomyces frigidus TaxID=1508187 RepID=A0AAN7TDB8_9PEZI|nr:hypothetical protein LTR62_008684 [Meristemomyces frigidus]